MIPFLKSLFAKAQLDKLLSEPMPPGEVKYVPPRSESRPITTQDIANRIVQIAESQVGVREVGHNSGTQVEMYQRAAGGLASGEPWCVAFCYWVADQLCKELQIANPLFKTEHAQTLFNSTLPKYKSVVPDFTMGRGFIFIMKHVNSNSGHAGFCKNANTPLFETIEGNTNEAGSAEGDGVYCKRLPINGRKDIYVRGFIDLPQMIFDEINKQPQRLG
jgi:hypothetical protein